MKYITKVADKEYVIEVVDAHTVLVDGVRIDVDFQSPGDQPVYSLLVDGKSFEAYVYESEDDWEVLLQGSLYTVNVVDEREQRLRAASGSQVSELGVFHLKAPMPGLIIQIPVSEGQEIEKGDVLVILESMKMQNELRAPRAGTISRIRAAVGDSVEQKEAILSLE